MSRRQRKTVQEPDRAERWLGPDEAARSRPWAYEEILLGSDGHGPEGRELSELAADLAVDLAELKRMQNELYDQVVRIACLEGRIQALSEAPPGRRDDRAAERVPEIETRSLPSYPAVPSVVEGGTTLARCEGFQVESPEGVLGFVEGLRFVSRIDEPDLLEVRGGRFGRELVLIPAEAVEEVVRDEERVVVRAAPSGLRETHSHELVNLLRRALHHEAT
jgi:hypothetical protein